MSFINHINRQLKEGVINNKEALDLKAHYYSLIKTEQDELDSKYITDIEKKNFDNQNIEEKTKLKFKTDNTSKGVELKDDKSKFRNRLIWSILIFVCVGLLIRTYIEINSKVNVCDCLKKADDYTKVRACFEEGTSEEEIATKGRECFEASSRSLRDDKEISETKEYDYISSIPLGNSRIQIPDFLGYTECYENSYIKNISNLTGVEANEIIAVYLNNKSFSNLEENNYLSHIDDFFKVWVFRQTKKMDINNKMFEELVSHFNKNSNYTFYKDVVDSYEDIKKDVFPNLKLGVPVLIENYQLNKSIVSSIILIGMEDNNEELTICTLNYALINKRLVSYSYYLDFNGSESIYEAKKINDEFSNHLLNIN